MASAAAALSPPGSTASHGAPGLPGQGPNKTVEAYQLRVANFLTFINEEKKHRDEAEAACIRAAEHAAAEQQRQQAEAAAAINQLRMAACTTLQQQEMDYAVKLRKSHFTPTESNSNATDAKKTKEDIAMMIAQLVATCNWQQQELQRLAWVIDSNWDQQHGTNRGFHTRIEDLENLGAATPGSEPRTGQSSTRQLEQRIDHVVATIGNLGTFAEPATISQQIVSLTSGLLSSPLASDPTSSPSLLSFGDSSVWSRIEDLDPLTMEDFQWLPLPPFGSLPKPHCNPFMAESRKYLHAAVPAPLTKDGVAVVDLCEYVAKIDLKYATQQYDDIDARLLYIRIQIGKATCSALIDCVATRNYISQDFMARAGLAPRVRRKLQPTQVPVTNGHTYKSIDWCINAVAVYFAPHARDIVSFDILDTKFHMTLACCGCEVRTNP
ncbi:hypothetical protein CBR_g52176 [Chara braunii]|uniref:Uncharacterized protein n=1 Tax=Chara braunii TaxID=69332 RepID=A0A388M9N7_CHABU|nr:hypothetical protein CBR_g52176 [Chara braunii]|eukprot:GBG91291.1 hypothetical protein CBR_g52176 [Chara braunii]